MRNIYIIRNFNKHSQGHEIYKSQDVI